MIFEGKHLRMLGVSIFLLYLAIYYWEKIAGFLYTGFGAVAPVLLGAVLAYMLNILMDMYEDYFFKKSEKPIINKIRRPVCLIGSIVTIAVIIGVLVYLVIPELVESATILVEGIPNGVRALARYDWFQAIVPDNIVDKLLEMHWKDYIDSAMKFFKGGIGGFAGSAMNIAGSVFSKFVSALFAIVFAIYFLGSKEKFQTQALRVMRVVVKKDYYDKTLHYLNVCNLCFHNYIVGKLVDAIVVGILCAIGMSVLRLPYVLMISVFVGFTALIPIVGTYLGIAAGAIIILTVSPMKALIFLIFIIIMIQFEANVIYPKLMSNSIGLPGVWVLAAVTVGGTIAGIGGMLIGVPIVATVYQISREIILEREKKLGLETLPEIKNVSQERWTKIKNIKNKAAKKTEQRKKNGKN
jgi:predicted PurR-regulated permease PerM